MAKLPFLLFRSLRLSHNSTCLCIEKCVRQSGKHHQTERIFYLRLFFFLTFQLVFVG
jgi:hypothetical protein